MTKGIRGGPGSGNEFRSRWQRRSDPGSCATSLEAAGPGFRRHTFAPAAATTFSQRPGDNPSMCGIVGYWQFRGPPKPDLPRLVQIARDRLTHRGPDDAGLYAADDGLCVL